MRVAVKGSLAVRFLVIGALGLTVRTPVAAQFFCGECVDRDPSWCQAHDMGTPCHQFETGDLEDHERGEDMHTSVLSIRCTPHGGPPLIVVEGWVSVARSDAEFWERSLPMGLAASSDPWDGSRMEGILVSAA